MEISDNSPGYLSQPRYCLCKDHLSLTSVTTGVHFPAKWVEWSVWHKVYVLIKYNNILHEHFTKYRFTICFGINIPTSRWISFTNWIWYINTKTCMQCVMWHISQKVLLYMTATYSNIRITQKCAKCTQLVIMFTTILQWVTIIILRSTSLHSFFPQLLVF